jgi:hypothetical protein
MRRSLRIPLLALMALAVLALAACGSSGGGSDAGTDKLLNDTFGKAETVESGRLKLGIDVRAAGIAGLPSPLTVRLGGPFERTEGKGTPKFDFDVTLATKDGRFTIGIVSTGAGGWVKLGSSAFTRPPDQFKKLAPGATGSKGGTPELGTLGVDPRGWIRNVQNEGVETLDGEKVIHLSADVDLNGLVKDLDKLLSSTGGTGLNAIAGLPAGIGGDAQGAVAKAVQSAGVDIWTGEQDHQLRRITIKLDVDTPTQKDGTVALDLAVAGLNKPQEISPPDDPRPLSELTAALAVLGQQRAQQATSGGAAPAGPGTGGSSQTYDECVQAAADDLAKAQACASLLG